MQRSFEAVKGHARFGSLRDRGFASALDNFFVPLQGADISTKDGSAVFALPGETWCENCVHRKREKRRARGYPTAFPLKLCFCPRGQHKKHWKLKNKEFQ